MNSPTKRYRVVITEITENVPTTEREWVRLFSDEVWKEMSYDAQEKAGGEMYGYRTKEDTTSKNRELYDQTVDDLNLQDVVAVVNGIKEAK